MFYVPEGFAHGFLTLEDETEFQYKCTDFYYPEYDSGIFWNDDILKIEWPISDYGILINELVISDKDKNLEKFDYEKYYF